MTSVKKFVLGLFCSIALTAPACAEANRVETKYFSAEIANIRRAKTGNVIVTLKFIPKIEETANLYVYSDIHQKDDEEPCPENKTILIDGNGDEHKAHNCLPPVAYGLNNKQSYINGMQIHAGSEAVFVYKFGLAGTSLESMQNMNLAIPIHYYFCDRQDVARYYATWSGHCSASPTTLSFYGVNAN